MLNEHKNRIKFSEIKCLRRLERKMKKDRIRNKSFRESLKIVEEVEKNKFKMIQSPNQYE